MLKISRITDYATVVMAYLAQNPVDIHNAKDITTHTHIALPTVSKILKLLAKAELLISHRGANGGYSLAIEPKKISIASIIKAIEGDVGLTECAHTDSHCQIEASCSIRGNWRVISQIVLNALEDISLLEMVSPMSTQSVSVDKLKQALSEMNTEQQGLQDE